MDVTIIRVRYAYFFFNFRIYGSLCAAFEKEYLRIPRSSAYVALIFLILENL